MENTIWLKWAFTKTKRFFLYLQLYEINDDPKRKEFLDDLFSFMQRRGKLWPRSHTSSRLK